MKLIQKVDGIAVTLTQQIASVERELNMRKNCKEHTEVKP